MISKTNTSTLVDLLQLVHSKHINWSVLHIAFSSGIKNFHLQSPIASVFHACLAWSTFLSNEPLSSLLWKPI